MQENNKQKVENILSRLKKCLDINTDSGLASKLGIDRSSVSYWKRRGTIDYTLIIEKFPDISIDYLLTGNGEAFIDKRFNVDDNISGDKYSAKAEFTKTERNLSSSASDYELERLRLENQELSSSVNRLSSSIHELIIKFSK